MSSGSVRRSLAAAVALASASLLALPALADDWEPLDPQQLALAHPIVDPDADAEALLWTVQVEDKVDGLDLLSTRDHFVRVKVFTQKGAQQWTKHDLDFPQKGVTFLNLAARTIRPDGSILKMDHKAVSREIVVKSRSGSTRRVSFALPGVQPGCIVEYRYREYRRDLNAYGDSYPLQLTVPVERVVYRIRPLEFPGLVMRQVTLHTTTTTSPVPVGGYYETVAVNQRAFVTEPDMPPEGQELAFLVLFYTVDEKATVETYWPSIGRQQAQWFDRGSKPDDSMRNAARQLTAGARSDLERVERLARWVRTEFHTVQSSSRDSLRAAGLRSTSDARAAWRQKGGQYLDAELVFGALARGAGLEVRWIMVPPRSKLFFDRNMLNAGFLSSYQIAIRIDGRWTTFDPVTPELPWDMRPWDEEATTALVCDRDSSRFIETTFSGPERTVRTRSADLALRPEGTLEGSVHMTWSGHFNPELRAALGDVAPENLDSLATQSEADEGTTMRLSHVSLTKGSDRSDPFELTAGVQLQEFASVTGKRIVLEPAVFQAHDKPRYSSSTRRHPVYFRFPWTEVDTVRIHLPEGWRVESADSAEPLTAEGVAEYRANVMISDDRTQVLYLRRFCMGIDGSIYFAPQYYAAVKQFFDGVHDRDRISLILSRADAKP